MNVKVILAELGLKDQEVSVFLALLQLGSSRASMVAKHLGLKRTTIYPILKLLMRKGLASLFYKGRLGLYQAKRPERVVSQFERRVQAFRDIVPALQSLEKINPLNSGTRFIETLAELKDFYADVLEDYKGKEYYIIGSAGAWEGLEPEFFVQFRKGRARAKIKTKLLLTADSKDISPTDPSLLREVKFLPEKYKFQSTIDIYQDKVLIVSPELSSLAVVIAVPAMVDVFRSVFAIMWEIGDFEKE